MKALPFFDACAVNSGAVSPAFNAASVGSAASVMTTHPTLKDLHEVANPIVQKHLLPGDSASLQEWKSGRPDLLKTGKALMKEATVLMASGDATSAEAMDFARRFRALTEQLMSSPSPAGAVMRTLAAKTGDARPDRKALLKIGVFGFIAMAVANLKAQENAAEGKG